MVKFYVDDFMSLVIPISQDQLQHVMTAVMTEIHNVFFLDANNSNNTIFKKKLLKEDGWYSTQKALLGFDFDSLTKMMWLESAKREKLLTILKGWVCSGMQGTTGILFKQFEVVMAKIWHAFTCIPAGVGLLSPCNRILKLCPAFVYLHTNCKVLNVVKGCQTLLPPMQINIGTHAMLWINVWLLWLHWDCGCI